MKIHLTTIRAGLKLTLAALFIIALAGGLPGVAGAIPISYVSYNLDQPYNPSNYSQANNDPTDPSKPGNWVTSSFYTAGGTGPSGYELAWVTLRLADFTLASDPNRGTLRVDIYLDAAGSGTGNVFTSPGNLVATLVWSGIRPVTSNIPPTSQSDYADITFSPSGTLTLYSDSTYWVVLKAVGNTPNNNNAYGFGWTWADTDSGSGLGFQDTWGVTLGFDSSGNPTGWYTGTGGHFMMGVSPAAIPLPGTLLLLGSGLLGLAGWRKKLRKT